MPADLMFRMDVDEASVRKIDHAIKVLPGKVYRRVVGPAANYAMTPVMKEMRAKYPGIIGEAVIKKRKAYASRGVVFVGVGPESKTIVVRKADGSVVKKNPAAIGRWYEYGTQAHAISARFKGGSLKIGPVMISGTVQHPGIRPRPVGRRAYLSLRRSVVRRYRKKLVFGIDKQVKKLRTV